MAVAGAPCLLLGQCQSHCASCAPVLCGQCVNQSTVHTSQAGQDTAAHKSNLPVPFACWTHAPQAGRLHVLASCRAVWRAGKVRCICARLPAAPSTGPPTTQLLCNLRQLHVRWQALHPCNSTVHGAMMGQDPTAPTTNRCCWPQQPQARMPAQHSTAHG